MRHQDLHRDLESTPLHQKKRPREGRGGGGRHRPLGLESLEPRHLLSVDLSGAFTAIPATAPNNSRQHFTIALQNSGDTAVRGGVPFSVYLLPEGAAFNPNADLLLGQFVRGGTLAGGATAQFTFTALISAAVAGGQYQVVAVIDPTNVLAETNETNNLAQSAPFTITQPNYDLVPAFGPTVRPGLQLNADAQ